MLTTDDFYDILSANERLLEENRRVQRLATETPRSAQLQERYLQQAARLGLIPARFTSPVRPSLSLLVPKPTPPAVSGTPAPSAAAIAAGKRPVPPPGYGGGRLSRDRAARELARAGSTQCNSAAAALAATEALYQRSTRHRFRSTTRASGSSDSDSSKDSSNSGSSSTTFTSSKLDLGNVIQNADDASHGRNGGRRSSDEWFRSSATMRMEGSNADGRGSRVRSNSGPRRERGSTRLAVQLSSQSEGIRGVRLRSCSCGDGGGGGGVGGSGGSRVGRFLREPTPSFMRRWKAARKRKHAKKQVVRFLLRTSDELGEVEGNSSGGAAGAGGSKTAAVGSGGSAGGSGGGGGPNVDTGVVIAYPGSSVLFPPAALPYSLAEALEAVRRQTAQLQLGGEWGREGGKGIATATAAAAPSQPLTPPHHHPTRAVDLNKPTPPPRLGAAVPAAAATTAPSSQSHPLQHPSPRQHQLPLQQMQLNRELIPVQRPTIYGELDLAASPTGFSGAQSPPPYIYSASAGGAPPPRWAIAVAPVVMGAVHPGGTAVSPPPLSTVAAAAGTAVPAGASTAGAAALGVFPGTARGMVGIQGHPTFTASRHTGLVRPIPRDDLGYGYDRYLHGSYDRSPLYGSVGVSAPGTPQGFVNPAGLVGLMDRGFQSAGGSVGIGVGVGSTAQVAGGSGVGGSSGPASAVKAQSNPFLQQSAHSMPVYTSVADTPMHTDPRVGTTGGSDAARNNPVLQSSSSPPGPRELTALTSSGRSGPEARFVSSAMTGSVAAGPQTRGRGDSGGGAAAVVAAAAFEGDSVRRAWLNDLPDDAPGSPVLSDPDIPSEAVSEAGDIAAPAATNTVRPGDPYLQSLRQHQSAIFRDVQVLMQRLADVRDRLGT
ncbi:hypothetical protein Vafri_16026 [Volvox africanus]|uniref:Uncharacterized protein n=1 Tax=Volvox africanus TaxID=51714 RepID=A0A8J4BHX3_9CHLO|nr:hypothetical protein Vafri_16026 [Volvox africanus]